MGSSYYYAERELANIKKYKAGVTIDKSLIYKYLVSPFCARFVTYMPSWLAPNVMTLGGLVCNVIAFLLAVTYLPNNPDPPRWVCLACAFLIWFYMILDNSDGKQSVRTGSSSPLGELLDHGCDSMIIGMGSLTTCYILNAGESDALYYSAFGMLAFYLAHWQEYFCHYLELGYFNGPTEAETFAILLYIATFFTGPKFWVTPIINGLKPVQLITYTISGVAIFTIFTTLWKGSELAKSKGISVVRALSALIPFTLSWIAAAVWVIYSPEVYYSHPNIFLNGINFIFSYLTINCILQRMCNLPYKYFYVPTIPLFVAAANSVIGYHTGLPPMSSEFLLYAATIYWFVVLAHFCVSIIQALCSQLGINALTIPYPNKGTKAN